MAAEAKQDGAAATGYSADSGFDVSFAGKGGGEAKSTADYYAQYGNGAAAGGYGQQGGYGQAGGYGGYGYGAPFGGPPGYGGYGAGPGGPFGGPPEAPSPLDAEVQMVIGEMRGELDLFASAGEYGAQFKNAKRLLTTEVERLEQNIDPEWLEVDIPKPIKLTKKILIPNFRHPHFNFVGKVLGPRGQTLQAMAKQFKCHIYVLGRGSTKDRNKEQEQLNSGDPQFAHFGGPLHVKVETIAPAHIAYQRVAGVLELLANTLLPVRDELVESQMAQLNSDGTGNGGSVGGEDGGDSSGGEGGRGRGRGGPRGGGGMGRGGPGGPGGFRGRGGPGAGGPMRGGPRGRGGPMMRGGGGRGRGMGGPGYFPKPGRPY